jgi:hypothetical protein
VDKSGFQAVNPSFQPRKTSLLLGFNSPSGLGGSALQMADNTSFNNGGMLSAYVEK